MVSKDVVETVDEVGAQAEAMLFQLVKQMIEQEGITEQLKADNRMKWIERTNSIHRRAEEITLRNLWGECDVKIMVEIMKEQQFLSH